MKIKFNNGFTVMEDKEPKFLWMLREKEASDNISDICARIKAKEIKLEMLR